MRRVLMLVTLIAACGRSAPSETAKGRASAELLLAHLPPDADAVVAGSLVELAKWPLWRRAVGVVAHEAPGIAEQITTRCKADPWTLLDNAALAFTGNEDGTLLAAETTLDRERLHACATEVAGQLDLTIEHGAITKYAHVDATEYAAWTGDRTFLALPMRMDDQDALSELVPERAIAAPLKDLLARADRDATVWGIALATGDGAVAELVRTIPLRAPALGVHGAIHRGDGIRAHVALVFADANAATEAKQLFDSLLANPPPWLAAWRDTIRIEARGDETRVVLQLDAKRAETLDAAVIGLLPAPTEPPPQRAAPN